LSDNESKDILRSMDGFIEKIQQLRGVMLGVSFSALILAPFAIGISLYLITHPKFLLLLEQEGDFGIILIVLLVGILVTSGIWLVTGIRQFRSLSKWNNRYSDYLKRKETLDNTISSTFHLDED
jgi:predicted PurR-regulated permease PerM